MIIGMKWYLVVLIWVSLLISDVEHLCVLIAYWDISFLEKLSTQTFAYFRFNLFNAYCQVLEVSCIFPILIPHQIYDLEAFFFHSTGCLFTPLRALLFFFFLSSVSGAHELRGDELWVVSQDYISVCIGKQMCTTNMIKENPVPFYI